MYQDDDSREWKSSTDYAFVVSLAISLLVGYLAAPVWGLVAFILCYLLFLLR